MRVSLSLTQKLLAFVTGLVVCLVLVTVWLANTRARHLAGESIRRGLRDAQSVWETFEADRYAKLKLGVRVLANDPVFKATVKTTHDHATVLDMLSERGVDIKADFFIATDDQGLLIARTDQPQAYGDDLEEVPVVARALDGDEAATVWRQGDRLFNAVSVPMTTGPEFVGVLVAGYALGEPVATQLERLTRCRVAFLVTEKGTPARISVSSLGKQQPALAAALAQGRIPMEGGSDPFPLTLDGEDYLGIAMPIEAASGDRVGTVVALRSLTSELASFRSFRTSLLLAALVVMAVALVLGYFAASRLARPIRRLVTAVEKARDGSYSAAVSADSSDEVGVLARAFSGLLADLREKEQLIAFLREGRAPLRRAAAGAEDETAVVDPYAETMPAPAGSGDNTLEGLLGGRYEIQDVLGHGGMGVVYRAYDRRLDETVALKVLRADVMENNPQLFERFKQEIKLARRVTHRNVLRTFDLDEIDGVPCISMEYVDGVSLKDLIGLKGALPLPVGLRVAKEMCYGLDAAHREGVVHRDIKPQNMLIVPETGELKIMDFGVAGMTKGVASGITTAGMVMGTPHYMSPEQAQSHAADTRSDIYAVGVVLFEIFTGKLPFAADNMVQILLKHVQEPPPRPTSVNPDLPPALEEIILSCLEKDPARRPQSVSEILKRLTSVSSAAEGRRAA